MEFTGPSEGVISFNSHRNSGESLHKRRKNTENQQSNDDQTIETFQQKRTSLSDKNLNSMPQFVNFDDFDKKKRKNSLKSPTHQRSSSDILRQNKNFTERKQTLYDEEIVKGVQCMKTSNSDDQSGSFVNPGSENMLRIKNVLRHFLIDCGLLSKLGGTKLINGLSISTNQAKKLDDVFKNSFEFQINNSSMNQKEQVLEILKQQKKEKIFSNDVILILNKVIKNFLLDMAIDQFSTIAQLVTSKFLKSLTNEKITKKNQTQSSRSQSALDRGEQYYKSFLSKNEEFANSRNDQNLSNKKLQNGDLKIQSEQKIPNYMTQTVVQKIKVDLKQKGALDAGDNIDIRRNLRQTTYNTVNSCSLSNLTKSIKGEDKKTAWKPTSQAVEQEIFDNIKVSQKLAPVLEYKRQESPLRGDLQAQNQFFERLHQESKILQENKQKLIEVYIKNEEQNKRRNKFSRKQKNESEKQTDQNYLTEQSPQNPDISTAQANEPVDNTLDTTQLNNQVMQVIVEEQKQSQNLQKLDKDRKSVTALQNMHESKSEIQTLSDSKQNEFFDNLSKSGMKTHRLVHLEQIKERLELEKCTFKPEINKNYRSPVRAISEQKISLLERLYDQGIEKQQQAQAAVCLQIIEEEKVKFTFKPVINPQTARSQSNADPTKFQPRHIRLYNNAFVYKQRKEEKAKEIQDKFFNQR